MSNDVFPPDAETESFAFDEQEQGWKPPESVMNHSGAPLFPGRDYFAPPPPEIGEVVTAASSMPLNTKPKGFFSRVLLASLIGSVPGVICSVFAPDFPLLWIIAFGIPALITWFATRSRHTCSYVGKLGVAQFVSNGGRHQITKSEIFPFDEAEELRTTETRQYYNGIYTGTVYNYTWTDQNRKKRFQLKGTYRGENKPPKPKDPYHFATLAERVWTLYRLQQAVEKLNNWDKVEFRVGSKDSVSVGREFIELNLRGREERIEAEELGEVAVHGSTLKFKRIDAQEGIFKSTGVFSVDYSNMSNAQLFLIVLQSAMGSDESEEQLDDLDEV